MRPLKIVLLSPDPERARGALTFAAAQAALGSEVAIFFQLEAVALLQRPLTAPSDAEHQAKGLPPLAELMDDATALGVSIVACQSGMELCGMEVGDIAPDITIAGPVTYLQSLGEEDRLVVI